MGGRVLWQNMVLIGAKSECFGDKYLCKSPKNCNLGEYQMDSKMS